MKQALHTVAETAALIESGKVLALAGEEALLTGLPRGRWIGGTTPYFIADRGGVETRERIFVTQLGEADSAGAAIRRYTETDICDIARDAPDNGFTLLIIPAFSAVHTEYANHARDYPGLFMKPIAGWVAGVHLAAIEEVSPKVIDGGSGAPLSGAAVALHLPLPPQQRAVVNILNPFRQGDGDVITFPQSGFSADTCLVNGRATLFADYIRRRGLDLQLPLVADYHGAQINTSFQRVDAAGATVHFYAPVFAGIEYRQAAPVGDYARAFAALAGAPHSRARFSCNCVLNYLYGDLRGHATGDLQGPVTFGEIAYQLLNQTLVYLDVQTL